MRSGVLSNTRLWQLTMCLCMALYSCSVSPGDSHETSQRNEVEIPFGRPLDLYNFYDVETTGGKECWVVGNYGTICYSKGCNERWEVLNSGVTIELYDITLANDDEAWVVGRSGVILYSKDGGKHWEPQESNTEEALHGICEIDGKLWVVGTMATVLYSDDKGRTWQNQSRDEDVIYNDITFVSEEDGWLVGEFGTIMRTKDGGKSWRKCADKLVSEIVTLFSVNFRDGLCGVISGMDGTLILTRDGGETWTRQNVPFDVNLFGTELIGNKGYCVGMKGTFAINKDIDNENEWEQLEAFNGGACWYRSCRFFDDKKGMVVGERGMIRYTEDGGGTWKTPRLLVSNVQRAMP